MITENELREWVNQNYSTYKIMREAKCCQSTVKYWLKKHGLKTHPKWDVTNRNKIAESKYDWSEIQKFYDDNHTWEDIQKHFGMSNATINRATKRGELKLRSRGKSISLHHKLYGAPKHSEETKKKISEARIRFLTANPDKVPYVVNHSSKKSWPEEVFENALKASNITGWIYKYRHGIYEYDFAFPDIKLDVEIDGGTHKSEKVKKIDKRRDDFSIKNGWRILRFEAEVVKKDVISCIAKLKESGALGGS